ncbi:hypothetical protein [Streptomyces sp. NRRL F-5755]|uniref:hypothetical protein n=1 Tax=Streptomyces sp. NRRL F-5755 TaxID=1519475 RepID=UPI000B128066|nr:hypothetical protein [Streptomyces sp. NRRL F-5755]
MAKRLFGNDRGQTSNDRGRTTNDRGQTSIEYLGIIAVVVAIVLVLSTTDFGSQIATAISNKISQVVGI